MNTILSICITIGCTTLLGLIQCCIEIISTRKNERIIQEFCNKASELSSLIEKGKKPNRTLIEYIAANYKQVSTIAHEEYPNMPAYDLGLNVRSANWGNLPYEVYHLQIDTISIIAVLEDNRKKLLHESLNPFSNFFKGISVILKIILGYPIKLFCPDFSFNNKLWNITCSIVGLISGLITIGLYIKSL